jgi:phage baseplate assembly protein W
METQRVSRPFKDISLSFEPHPVTKDVPILRNENAITRSVRNLVQTIRGEVFFNADKGTNIQNTLFDFVDIASASSVQSEIETTLAKYEPRIENVKVFVDPVEDTNEFNVTVSYDIIGQEFPTQQFSFLLEVTR